MTIDERLLRDLDPAHEGTVTGVKGLTTDERTYLRECVRLRQAFDAMEPDASTTILPEGVRELLATMRDGVGDAK